MKKKEREGEDQMLTIYFWGR